MTRTTLTLALAAIAIMIWLFVIAQVAQAVTPIDYECNGAVCAVYVDTPYCYAGSLYNLPYYNFTDRQNETFDQYVNRKLAEIFNRPLNTAEAALCATLRTRNTVQWVVQQYRTSPNRPVKRIVNGMVDTADTIGRINYGTPCGNAVQSTTTTMWREVTLTYPDGSNVVGAAVCEQAP